MDPSQLSVMWSFAFREQALKKRLALVNDSLNTALADSSSHRRDNGEQIARLTQAHRYVSRDEYFIYRIMLCYVKTENW